MMQHKKNVYEQFQTDVSVQTQNEIHIDAD